MNYTKVSFPLQPHEDYRVTVNANLRQRIHDVLQKEGFYGYVTRTTESSEKSGQRVAIVTFLHYELD